MEQSLTYNQQQIIQILNLKRSGSKGWYAGNCPFCGKEDKFGVIFNSLYRGKTVSNFNCYSASCDESGGLFKLLKHINRLDLFSGFTFTKQEELVSRLNIKQEEVVFEPLKEISFPMGYKRIHENEYLENERGFNNTDFTLYECGISRLNPLLKDYIIFPIKQRKSLVGYVCRSIHSKQWHVENEEKAKRGIGTFKERYKNSLCTDFSKMIYGLDEFTDKTEMVILAEGIFSKRGVDLKLDLHNQEFIKCGATFGAKTSEYQIQLLRTFPNIKKIILFYDPGTIKIIKNLSFELLKYFEVGIVYNTVNNNDPDDMGREDMLNIFNDLQDPYLFARNRLEKKELKLV